jgi:hypothetical protein
MSSSQLVSNSHRQGQGIFEPNLEFLNDDFCFVFVILSRALAAFEVKRTAIQANVETHVIKSNTQINGTRPQPVHQSRR